MTIRSKITFSEKEWKRKQISTLLTRDLNLTNVVFINENPCRYEEMTGYYAYKAEADGVDAILFMHKDKFSNIVKDAAKETPGSFRIENDKVIVDLSKLKFKIVAGVITKS